MPDRLGRQIYRPAAVFVTCPIALFRAPNLKRVNSNQTTRRPIARYVKVDAESGEEVAIEDIVKAPPIF